MNDLSSIVQTPPIYLNVRVSNLQECDESARTWTGVSFPRSGSYRRSELGDMCYQRRRRNEHSHSSISYNGPSSGASASPPLQMLSQYLILLANVCVGVYAENPNLLPRDPCYHQGESRVSRPCPPGPWHVVSRGSTKFTMGE